MTEVRASGTRRPGRSPAMTVIAWIIALLAIALTALGGLLLAQSRSAAAASPSVAVMFVSPHPDDEFQMWSLVENRPDEYKIFVNLTRGEQSGFCEPGSFEKALQENLGEVPPTPEPNGRWTEECEGARMFSLLGFLSEMSLTDPSVPGDFAEPSTHGPYPAEELNLCRVDDTEEYCGESVREAVVWLDTQGRGAVVSFNLGDGDVTAEAVQWALQTLIDHRESWGVAETLEIGAIVGAFANEGTRCFSYPHPDHTALRDTLWNVNFGVGPQLGATCYVGRAQSMSAVVSSESSVAAFAMGEDRQRLGAHGKYYGWLHMDIYPLAWYSQDQLFHRLQSFWVRFN